jgi:uncharacterized protein
MPTLTSLTLYPLKSCAGLSVTQAALEPLGLEHDRRWMAVGPDGQFMTGRELSALLRIQARPLAGGLVLEAPGMPRLQVPAPPADAPRLDVTVWDSTCSAALVDPQADAWLTHYLGQPARLVHVDARTDRPVSPQYAGREDRVGFADGYPVLVVSQGSLDELNRRLDVPVPMARFRPNLVVDGCPPFAEDGWRRIRLGDVELEIVKPCSRCVLINTEPDSAQPDPRQEPLRTLSTYRRSGAQGPVFFGQNAVVRRPGVLRVGEALTVLE